MTRTPGNAQRFSSFPVFLLVSTACKGDSIEPGIADLPDWLTTDGVQACDQPREDVEWEEVGEAAGFAEGPLPDASHLLDGGAMVHDFDDNGWDDLVAGFVAMDPESGRPEYQVDVYWSDGESWSRETFSILALAFALVDLDGDGVLDLANTGLTLGGLDYASGSWDTLGLADTPEWVGLGTGAVIMDVPHADLDGDGAAELLAVVGRGSSTEQTWWDFAASGDGQGNWEVDTSAVPEELGNRAGFDGISFDADDDGDLDIYVVNDNGDEFGGNVLYMAEDGQLVDGSDSCGCDLAHDGMGIASGDFDGDGNQDLYVTATGRNRLLLGEGEAIFADHTAAQGADTVKQEEEMGFGAAMLDFDNDGDTDLLAVHGDLWNETEFGEPHERLDGYVTLLEQTDDGLVDISEEKGLPQEGSFRSVVAADVNRDGVLDLWITDVVARPQLWLSTGCTEEQWLEVRAPHGTRVQVYTESGAWTGWASTDGSYAAAQSPIVHFGLGGEQQVDEVRVRLPGGETRTATGPFETRQRLLVRP
ncbi:MAG: CRTAC1 family protein [Myxococcota bacterium]|nr:CRTAC1 family protein [Myxococcota bacterium]